LRRRHNAGDPVRRTALAAEFAGMRDRCHGRGGQSNRDIANKLHVPVRTVGSHHRACIKLDVSDRDDL
jgi:hypothetical protein